MPPNDNSTACLTTFHDLFWKLEGDKEHVFQFFSMERATFMREQTRTFGDMFEDIRTCYDNLVHLGIKPGETLCFNIWNDYRFFVLDYALILLGVRTLLHSRSDPVELLLDRLTRFNVHYLVTDQDIKGLDKSPDHCKQIALSEFFKTDAPRQDIPRHDWKGEDTSIVFSSGTTGIPKGLGVSERGSILTGINFFQFMGFGKQCTGGTHSDKFMIYLPLASYQQRFLMWGCLSCGVDIVLVDDKLLFRGLQTFHPTLLIAPPNFYFNLYRMNTGTKTQRLLRKLLPHIPKNKLLKSILKTISRKYTNKVLYNELGGNTRYLITGMAPIDMKVLQHFRAAYLDIQQIYGQTEIGMIAGNTVEDNTLGTVGKPIIPLHLAPEDNEIITNSDFPTIASYYINEENNENNENNSFPQRQELGKRIPTGDVGHIDAEGRLTIKGRKNETLILKSGIKISPTLIENKIKAKMPDIDEVLIYKPGADEGENRKLRTVLLLKPDVEVAVEKVKEIISGEHEIKQSSEGVDILTYRLKGSDRGIMYTENNKFRRARTITYLKENKKELKEI